MGKWRKTEGEEGEILLHFLNCIYFGQCFDCFCTDQRSSVRNQTVEIKYDGGVYFLIQRGRDRMEKAVLDFAFGRFTLGLL